MNKLKTRLSFIKRNYKIFSLADFLLMFYYYVRLRRIIAKQLSTIVSKYYINNPNNSWDASKYLNIDIWVLENLGRVFELKLHRKNNLSVLDIGAGYGYFPLICKYFGHAAECTDLDTTEIYNEVIDKLELKRHIKRIEKYTDFNIEGKFDVITAFMICFNNHKQPDLWHIDEWDYFINDLHTNNLNPGGEIFLSFNIEKETEPIDKELLAYFALNNAEIRGNTVHIKGNYRFNQ